MASTTSSAHGNHLNARAWRPRPCRPSSVEPTASELLEMAAGTRADWRREPTTRDIRSAEREIPNLLAEFAALLLEQLPQLEKEGREARAANDGDRVDAAEKRIHDLWDAVGHLAVGA